MMNYYLDKILNELMIDDRINDIYGIAKDNNKKVYISGGEYEQRVMELIFLVDTGDLFKKTIAFTISTNSFSAEIYVIKHYSLESKTFSRRPVKNISEYIINEILEFKNQENLSNKYLKVANE
ncbi:hypothetical protein [Clostridium lacusfryxellense]|uniref:hypothetical protein n=1 Tax=Clostridium lacusfryxellense TaxID=205328 RepID=UPI001C0D5955|nr:hypothetical protein [Clostridium lacusfryxellense]MBU3113211.1 hypothetical protein [Clostridium lacusfryxellense]